MFPLRAHAHRLAATPLAATSAVLGANTLLSGGLGFAFWTIAARTLPVAEVGRASVFTAGLGLLIGLAALGIPETLIRHLPYSRTPRAFVARLAGVTIAAGIVSGGVYALLPAAGILPPLLRPVAAIGITVPLLLAGIANATLLAERRPVAILAGSAAAGAAKCAALLVVADATGAIAAYGAGAVIGVLLAGTIAWRRLPARSPAADGVRHPLRGYAVGNWLSNAAALLPLSIAPGLILARAGAEAAAYTAIPVLLLTFLTLPATVVGRTLFAEASRHPDRLARLVWRAVPLALAGSIAALAGAALFGDLVLSVFGAGYAGAGQTLLVLLAVASVVSLPSYLSDAILNVRRDMTGLAIVNLGGSGAVTLALLCFAHDPVSLGLAWIGGQAVHAALAVLVLAIRARPAARGSD